MKILVQRDEQRTVGAKACIGKECWERGGGLHMTGSHRMTFGLDLEE